MIDSCWSSIYTVQYTWVASSPSIKILDGAHAQCRFVVAPFFLAYVSSLPARLYPSSIWAFLTFLHAPTSLSTFCQCVYRYNILLFSFVIFFIFLLLSNTLFFYLLPILQAYWVFRVTISSKWTLKSFFSTRTSLALHHYGSNFCTTILNIVLQYFFHVILRQRRTSSTCSRLLFLSSLWILCCLHSNSTWAPSILCLSPAMFYVHCLDYVIQWRQLALLVPGVPIVTDWSPSSSAQFVLYDLSCLHNKILSHSISSEWNTLAGILETHCFGFF